MIEYKENKKKELIFGMVEEGQFFYSNGCLCQKVNQTRSNMIALKGGLPCANETGSFVREQVIDAICKHVTKISIDVEG